MVKVRVLFATVILGLIALAISLSLLSGSAPQARADVNASIYYVHEGGTGTFCAQNDPCGSIQQAINMTYSGDEVRVAAGDYYENVRIVHGVQVRGGWDATFSTQDPEANPTLVGAQVITQHVFRVEDNVPQQDAVLFEGLTIHDGQDGIHIWNGDVTVSQCQIYNVNRQGVEVDGGTVLITNTQVLTSQQALEVDGGIVDVVNSTLAKASEEGVLVEHVTDQPLPDVTIRDSIVEQCANQGVHINSGVVKIQNSTVRNVISDGIKVDGGTVVITGNIVSHVTGYAADGDGYPGVYVGHAGDTTASATVYDNEVHNISGRGIFVEDANATVQANVVHATGNQGIYGRGGTPRIIGNTVYDTSGDGIRIHEYSVSADIRDNTVYESRSDGIDARVMDSATIMGNEVYSITERGIYARNGAATISDNEVHHVGSDGIRVHEDSTTAEIRDNVIYQAGSDGVEVREINQATITGNRVYDVVKHGIAVSATATIVGNEVFNNTTGYGIVARLGVATIVSNTVHTTDGDGIRVEETSTSAEVRDNVVYEVGNDGIDVRPTDYALVIGNRVYKAAEQGVYARTTVTIADNDISEVITYGIYTRDAPVTITGNRVYSTGDDGIHTDNSNPIVNIQKNTVYAAGNDGIDARGGQVSIVGNLVRDNADNGIKVEDIASSVKLEANQVFSNTGDGVAIRAAPAFTLLNNIVGDHKTTNIELGSKDADLVKQGVVYHNTIVGSGTGQDGNGLVVRDPLTATLVNNIIVSHTKGLSLPLGANVQISYTLFWANADDPTGTPYVPSPPLFVDPAHQNYHLLAESPAVDAGTDVSVTTDVDGNVRPQGDAPDLGADEVLAATAQLEITKSGPQMAAPGAPITYTLTVVNRSGGAFTQLVITDSIPAGATFIGATEGGRTVLLPGREAVRWEIPSLAGNGATYMVEFAVTANQTITNADYGVSTAEGTSASGQVAVVTTVSAGGNKIFLPLILNNYPPPPPAPEEPAAYQIFVDPADLDKLASDPYSNETVPATFVYERGWSVDMRYRGDTSRLLPKKSWKLYFPGSDLFQGSTDLNLNADVIDQTLLRSRVGYDFIARAGVPAPRTKHARVYINGGYQGLYSQVEQIDERFLQRRGFNIHGNLYKPFYGNLKPVDPIKDYEEWWDRHYENKTYGKRDHNDLKEFIRIINETPNAQFPEAIAEVLDVNGWIDWYATNVLLGNFEMIDKNHYIYHDLSTDRWHFLPWDVDLALGHNAGFGGLGSLFDSNISWDNPLDSGTAESTKIDGKWNALIDRMMDVQMPEFRYFYARRLVELMEGEFSPEETFPRIDTFFEGMYPYGEADPNRWKPPGFGFASGPDELKAYINGRRTWVYEQLPHFMPSMQPPLILNEVAARGISGLTDEAGEPAPWFEIYNASTTLTWDLGGMYLSDDVNQPRRWRFPEHTEVPPQGTVLVWADGEPGEGVLHTSFVLTETGGVIGLWDRDVFDNAPIFVVTYTAQMAGGVYGRWPDGASSALAPLTTPTPGWRNQGRPPVITATTFVPDFPVSSSSVAISAMISDESAITATVWYRVYPGGTQPTEYQPLAMDWLGGGQWRAYIPPQSDGTWVEFYVEATDDVGMVTVDRPGWPQGDYRYVVGYQVLPLYINEIVAINTHFPDSAPDGLGSGSPDWVEIYNAGDVDLDIGGMFLSDDPLVVAQYRIPDGTIVPAKGYYTLWADGEGVGDHANFSLSGAGEGVALFDRAERGYALVDAVYFSPQEPNTAWGRFPDGGERWRVLDMPTPGGANRLHAPQVARVARDPVWPVADELVTVTAVVTSGSSIVMARLWFDAGAGAQTVDLEGDAGVYTAQIPTQPKGTKVGYFVELVDSLGQRTFYPPKAPAVKDEYRVGYAPPAIVINEFLADNKTANIDEAGEHDDWVEVYNKGDVPVSLEGFYLTDNLANAKKWAFPADTVIEPGGYLLVWCDDTVEQGAFHAEFKLAWPGESLGLFDASADIMVDWLVFGPQQEDVSYGRRPDGAETWDFLTSPTPGGRNE